MYIHPSEAEYVRSADLCATAAWVTPDEVMPKPEIDWSSNNFYKGSMGTKLKEVTEGMVFDLGNRKFEVK